jgi:PAS domain S-box-containing protein
MPEDVPILNEVAQALKLREALSDLRRHVPLPVLWLLAALAIFCGIAVVSYQSIDSVGETSAQVEQTHRAISDLEDLLSNLKDAEAGQRGFIASGDERFLESYDRALRALPENLRRLEESLSDHARQRNALIALGNNVNLRLRILAMPIELRRSGKPQSAAEATEMLVYGKYMMDDIRTQIEVLQQQEENLLARHKAMEDASARNTKQLIIIGNLCAIILVLASFSLLRRENQRRRRAEAIARRNASEVQDLYDHAPCGYHSCDEDAIFLNINQTELQWLGYSAEEIIGKKSLLDLLTEGGRRRFMEYFSAFKERGYINDIELEVQRKDGSIFIASVNSVVVRDAAGKYVMSRSTMFDVTERHKSHAQIEHLNTMLQSRAAELEAANKELESFTYTVSHDLRAPLRAINGFATMIEEDFDAVLNAEGKRQLRVIRDSATRMGALIDDLLAFSRLGRTTLQQVPVDMRALIEEVIAEINQAQPLENARIELDDIPPAQGDRTLLRQVWSNLLQNALKYSGRREKPLVQVRGEVQADEIIYRVSDNGVGFDMQYYGKLFGVFHRLHDSESFPGTGVGLAIVQRVIERHGGRVWAQAEPERGARFYFSLPRNRNEDRT